MNGRRLLIDAGNTRLKWAVAEENHWRAQGSCEYPGLAELATQLTAGTLCYIASVAKGAHEQQLAALLDGAGIDAKWLKAEPGFAGVTNSYVAPSQLGVDRWMGLIAARHRTREPVLVVSVGTAMTVDALAADGTFLGGVIVPGVTLMRRALAHGTARVADVAGQWLAFPRTTADAVQSGIVAALCGAIERQHARLAEVSRATPECLLTGGDAEVLLPYLSVPAECAPSLVLEGVDCVAREGVSR